MFLSGKHKHDLIKLINKGTGKSFSEVLIYLSINPQYDNKLFNDLQVQYKKIPRAEHVKNMSRTCYVFTQIVLNVQAKNMSKYCLGIAELDKSLSKVIP